MFRIYRMNELIEHKSWWKRNWKWFTPMVGLFLMGIGLIISSEVGETISNTVRAYSDSDLVDNALRKAQENKEVIALLGTLEPLDKLAILEGVVKYSNDDTSIDISFRVRGSKGKGRMRIFADKIGDNWDYKEVVMGIKKLKKTIIIIERKE